MKCYLTGIWQFVSTFSSGWKHSISFHFCVDIIFFFVKLFFNCLINDSFKKYWRKKRKIYKFVFCHCWWQYGLNIWYCYMFLSINISKQTLKRQDTLMCTDALIKSRNSVINLIQRWNNRRQEDGIVKMIFGYIYFPTYEGTY